MRPFLIDALFTDARLFPGVLQAFDHLVERIDQKSYLVM